MRIVINRIQICDCTCLVHVAPVAAFGRQGVQPVGAEGVKQRGVHAARPCPAGCRTHRSPRLASIQARHCVGAQGQRVLHVARAGAVAREREARRVPAGRRGASLRSRRAKKLSWRHCVRRTAASCACRRRRCALRRCERRPAMPVPLPIRISGRAGVGAKPEARMLAHAQGNRVAVAPRLAHSQPDAAPRLPSSCRCRRTSSSRRPSAGIEAIEYSRGWSGIGRRADLHQVAGFPCGQGAVRRHQRDAVYRRAGAAGVEQLAARRCASCRRPGASQSGASAVPARWLSWCCQAAMPRPRRGRPRCDRTAAARRAPASACVEPAAEAAVIGVGAVAQRQHARSAAAPGRLRRPRAAGEARARCRAHRLRRRCWR